MTDITLQDAIERCETLIKMFKVHTDGGPHIYADAIARVLSALPVAIPTQPVPDKTYRPTLTDEEIDKAIDDYELSTGLSFGCGRPARRSALPVTIPGLPPADSPYQWIGESADGRQWVLRFSQPAQYWVAYGAADYGGGASMRRADKSIVRSYRSPIQPQPARAAIPEENANG